MTRKRTKAGREVEEALGEVLAHVRGARPICRCASSMTLPPSASWRCASA